MGVGEDGTGEAERSSSKLKQLIANIIESMLNC